MVKISTSHYVLPAIYCIFKRVGFLKYLPIDLVKYMKYITSLNRGRNKQIIKQLNYLNRLFLKKGVKPIFLKGAGNILEGLYEDIAERMLIDIDLLFSKKDFFKAIDIIKDDNYIKTEGQLEYFPKFRHYSRLVKDKNIAAVEIHDEVITEKYRKEFDSKKIVNDTQIIKNFSVLSFDNQLSLSIITDQINDNGFELKSFSLRNAYDVFLLSKKVDTKNIISKFVKLRSPINCFLANCNYIFGHLESLKYFKTKESEIYIREFSKNLNKRRFNRIFNIKLKIINLKRIFSKVCKSILNTENRSWLINRIKRKISE